MEKEKELVDAQNEIFSGGAIGEAARNISKATKLILRLSVVLHVFTDRMMQALGQGGGDIPNMTSLQTMQRAVVLANWFQDNRQTLEKVSISILFCVKTAASRSTFRMFSKSWFTLATQRQAHVT